VIRGGSSGCSDDALAVRLVQLAFVVCGEPLREDVIHPWDKLDNMRDPIEPMLCLNKPR